MDIRLFEYEHLGAALKHVRRSRGLKMFELEELMGINQNTLRDIEHGRRNPTPETIKKFCKALGIKIFYGLTMSPNDMARMIDMEQFERNKS